MHDIIFFNFLSISDFLCRFASSKKSKNIYSGKDTSIIRWPKRRVTALKIVRTLFLGPRPRLFPPPPQPGWEPLSGCKKQLKIKGTRNYYFKTRFYATWPFSLRLSFCGFTGTWPTRNSHSYTYSFLSLQRNQTVTVPSSWLSWNFGANYQRSLPWPAASFLHIMGFTF